MDSRSNRYTIGREEVGGVGIHAVYVTASVYSGTLSILTRGVFFTIDAGNFEALLLLVEQDAPEGRPFTVQTLEEIKKA